MFFNSTDEIIGIAQRVNCAIFVLPDMEAFSTEGLVVLEPTSKKNITIEQVKELLGRLLVKQTKDQFIVIRPAENLGIEAANALLKSLEEPQDRIHFILITKNPSSLLPTILSRAVIYFLRNLQAIDGDIGATKEILNLARRLIVARPADLVGLASEITKKKDGTRAYALEVLAVTIEMLYKSYFRTGKMIFIEKIPKFLKTYENIERNGHIKLHLIADLC